VSRETGQLPSAGLDWFTEESTPPDQLGRGFMDLRANCEALERDPENDEAHDACAAKLAQVARLTGELTLAPEIRKQARRRVMDATRWLASMPVAQRRAHCAD
jgi:hypothetical protein